MPEELDFGLNISNRSGTLTNAEYSIPALKKSLKKLNVIIQPIIFLLIIMVMFKCVHTIGRRNLLQVM